MTQPIHLIADIYCLPIPEDAWILKSENWRTDFVINMGYLTYPRVGKKKWLSLDGMPGIKFPGLDYNEKAKGAIKLPEGNWQIICTTKDATEEQAKGIAEMVWGGYKHHWKDEGFVPRGFNSVYDTAKASLNSRLTSKGLDPVNKNYIILKKTA